MSFFEGDVTAWLDTVGPLVDHAGDDGPVATAASMFGPVQKWGRVEFPLPEYRAPVRGRDELVALMDKTIGDNWPVHSTANMLELIADELLAAGWRAP
jgi:hypothetical protein